MKARAAALSSRCILKLTSTASCTANLWLVPVALPTPARQRMPIGCGHPLEGYATAEMQGCIGEVAADLVDDPRAAQVCKLLHHVAAVPARRDNGKGVRSLRV
eukprot:CAMPEP_0115542370 /NCGR_PEP_ID=MMETSP0271-20121206/90952_1 /TAXON_ID=71861 /ORGANISM="Scrippsiella trochoidea, Strain CCMP3099" /LENGTH=102 /DNA_ID=CAMNT_0002975481 /DNA_START=104 /DNA_END=413 /DNA_ORIENTATION=+